MRDFIALTFLIFALNAHASGCTQGNLKKDGSFVLNDASPCLKDGRVREQVEARALAGDNAAAMLLSNFYLDGAGASDEQAIRWLRIYYKRSGAVGSVLFAQLLMKSAKSTDVTEGIEILGKNAGSGDIKAANLLADNYASSGKHDDAKRWYEFAALRGDSDSMTKLGESLLSQEDGASQSFGVLWTLIAANEFSEGTFKNVQLRERALSAATKLNLRLDVVEPFAQAIAESIHKPTRSKQSASKRESPSAQ